MALRCAWMLNGIAFGAAAHVVMQGSHPDVMWWQPLLWITGGFCGIALAETTAR